MYWSEGHIVSGIKLAAYASDQHHQCNLLISVQCCIDNHGRTESTGAGERTPENAG